MLSLWLPALLAGCFRTEAPAQSPSAAPQQIASFLERHWRRPLAPQGAAPARFTPQEAALDPASCGTCHIQQFEDWRGARHAAAMGPGVLGQLIDMGPHARQEHQACIRCHAPLAEQADSLVAALAAGHKPAAGLHEHGIVCAACHVRGYQHFGPARRDGSVARPEDKLPHGGWTANAAFADSRFCAGCHQFEPDGFALNGKLLENTYEEWKASPYPGQGRHCQSCHMPDRRHLWRGIHDPAMVRSGVGIEAAPPRLEAGVVRAALTVRNTGTGHHFPTYVTPKVVVEMEQEGHDGRVIAGTRREYVIARQVPLDLSRESADTRLAAGAQATLDYAVAPQARAVKLVYRIRVEPDAFYTAMYRSLLAGAAGQGKAMIRQALADSLASHFVLFEERRALPAPAS